jgi:hypothetical protein
MVHVHRTPPVTGSVTEVSVGFTAKHRVPATISSTHHHHYHHHHIASGCAQYMFPCIHVSNPYAFMTSAYGAIFPDKHWQHCTAEAAGCRQVGFPS